MRTMLVRAGQDNELIGDFLRSASAAVGWKKLGDLEGSTLAGIESALLRVYPEGRLADGSAKKHYREILDFVFVNGGDTIVTPHRAAKRMLVGTVSGPYTYVEHSSMHSGGEPYRHALPVNWTHAIRRADLPDWVFRDTDQRGKTAFWLRPETGEAIAAAPRAALRP